MTRLLAALVLLAFAAIPAAAQSGCVRLSWGSCDPLQANGCFLGQGKYQLVVSAAGVGMPNVGTNLSIRIRAIDRSSSCVGGYPDAWRFDEGGCEGPSRLAGSTESFGPDCPTLRGGHQQSFFDYSFPEEGDAVLRMGTFYDLMSPDPSSRYTLWVITFDLTKASAGPGPPDGSTCGAADQCGGFFVDDPLLLDSNFKPNLMGLCEPNPLGQATWNGGCGACGSQARTETDCGPVPATASTWGRVRATYR